MEKKINILGTTYSVFIGIDPEENSSLGGRMGYCIPSSRKIVVADLEKVESWKEEPEEGRRMAVATTLRHEVIHAFFAESGLWSSSMEVGAWAMNEEMVDWFAIQLPKIIKVFEQLGCSGTVYGFPDDNR